MQPSSVSIDRRSSVREYFMRVVDAEIMFGQRGITFEKVRIGDVSKEGIGVRPYNSLLALKPGMAITVATPIDGAIVSLPGRVASTNYGHVGIEIGAEHHASLHEFTRQHADRVAITHPAGGVSRVSGMLSMFARHPMRWAIDLGARRFDLSQVRQMDSSGIGLLLLMQQMHGIGIEKCPPRICQLVNLCRENGLCGECPKRSAATQFGQMRRPVAA